VTGSRSKRRKPCEEQIAVADAISIKLGQPLHEERVRICEIVCFPHAAINISADVRECVGEFVCEHHDSHVLNRYAKTCAAQGNGRSVELYSPLPEKIGAEPIAIDATNSLYNRLVDFIRKETSDQIVTALHCFRIALQQLPSQWRTSYLGYALTENMQVIGCGFVVASMLLARR